MAVFVASCCRRKIRVSLHRKNTAWLPYLWCKIATTILRKTIEGYFDSDPSLTFNKIKSKPIMHAFYSSIYLQSK